MKTILTGNEAIEMYEEIQGSYSFGKTLRVCGYFISDDCNHTDHYDKGTVIAFDTTDKYNYEEVFSTVQEAIDWINQ